MHWPPRTRRVVGLHGVRSDVAGEATLADTRVADEEHEVCARVRTTALSTMLRRSAISGPRPMSGVRVCRRRCPGGAIAITARHASTGSSRPFTVSEPRDSY